MTSLLFVCTGNVCRSPMAAALAADLLGDTEAVSVSSAGLLSEGQPPTPLAVAVMSQREIDITRHRSQRLGQALADDPDLVLVMEERHLREVALAAPHLTPRAFLLKDLERQVAASGPRHPEEPLGEFLARLDRQAGGPHDEVTDPIGGSPADYEACAAELERLLRSLTAGLWPSGRASD